jgi:hypothetical protein
LKRLLLGFLIGAISVVPALSSSARGSREFLTEEEIALVQAKQKIGPRVEYYLRIAALRLESARARLQGEETLPGDPLEYFTPEDMLDGYYKIMNSVMLNLEDAYRKSGYDAASMQKVMKELRDRTEEGGRSLEVLETLAKERDDEQLLRLIARAKEITTGAHEGAAEALQAIEEESGEKTK